MSNKNELVGKAFELCSSTFMVKLSDVCDWKLRSNKEVYKAQDILISTLYNKRLLSLREIAEYIGAPNPADILRVIHSTMGRDEDFMDDLDVFMRLVEEISV